MTENAHDEDRSHVRVIQRVELAHPETERTLPLFIGTAEDAVARREWERFARATGLPAIDAREVSETVRAAEDVDKSVKDLAAEGRIDAEWRNEAAPERIDLRHEGDEAMTVTLPPAIPDLVWRAMQGAAALILLLGLVEMAVILIIVAVAFGGVAEIALRTQRSKPRTLHLTRRAVEYSEPARSGNDFTMPLSRIESIDVVRAQIGNIDAPAPVKSQLRKVLSHEVLAIGSDDAEHRIGGLRKAELTWLRRFLRSAVAHA